MVSPSARPFLTFESDRALADRLVMPTWAWRTRCARGTCSPCSTPRRCSATRSSPALPRPAPHREPRRAPRSRARGRARADGPVARGYPVRLGATLRLYQLDKLELGGEDGEVYALTLMPALAASTEVPLGRQLRMEPGAGWGLQLREGIAPATPLMWRHGPEVSLTFVAMQRLYAQAGATWFLDGCANDNRCSRTGASWQDRPNPVTTHEREYRLSIGWRVLLR